jgi:hypothetical protein
MVGPLMLVLIDMATTSGQNLTGFVNDNPEKMAPKGTQDEEKHNAICVGHHYPQTNTNNNVNKT